MIKKHTGDIRSFLNPATLEAASSPIGNAYEVTMVDAHKIYVNEKNLYGIRGIEEMANSMAVSDNIPPLVVTPIENGKYKLISGERRLSAVLLREQRGEIENPKVPCFIREIQPIGPLSAEQSEMMLLILENAHRDKTPLEKLNEIKAMEPMARKIYADERAKGNIKGSFRSFFAESVLNMSEASVKRLKALDRLIPDVKDALEDGRISQSVSVELSKKSEEEQRQFLARLENGGPIEAVQAFSTDEVPEESESQTKEAAQSATARWMEAAEKQAQEKPTPTKGLKQKTIRGKDKTEPVPEPEPEKPALKEVQEKTPDLPKKPIDPGQTELFCGKKETPDPTAEPEQLDEDFAWEKVESHVADKLRELIAAFQHYARQTDNADIEVQNNRVAAVYDILVSDYLELAIAAAITQERLAKENET